MKKIIGIFILLIVIFSTSCNVKSFDYRDVKNFKIDKFGFDKTSIYMELVYFNPNSFGVTLKNVDCDIFINNNLLGHYKLDTSLHIDKRSEFVLPSKISVDMKNIYKNALNTLLNNQVDVIVKGTVKVKKGISFTKAFEYKGKHKIM